jgi:hypothetical protein
MSQTTWHGTSNATAGVVDQTAPILRELHGIELGLVLIVLLLFFSLLERVVRK